jgi:hypothetical protein
MECLMPALTSDQLTHDLHETNRRLSVLLNSLPAPTDHAEDQSRAATPQQMSGLLSELMRAGEWLRAMPKESGAALEQEISEYRRQVERLRERLPLIHGELLRERARLELERERVRSASEWARLSRQTL